MSKNIISLATNPGGAVNIIKISGPDSLEIINYFFSNKIKKTENNLMKYGFLKSDGEVLDEVLVVYFKEKKSYTYEEMVEIHTHGSYFIVNKIINKILKSFKTKIRIAKPGEFTKKAFLNGRISINKANATRVLSDLNSDLVLKSSLKQLKGSLDKEIDELKKKISYINQIIEVNIDYPEYEDFSVSADEIKQKTKSIKNDIKIIIKKIENGSILSSEIKVGIIGKPNVGKSSLLNFLSKEDKAIVSNIKGTTRDLVENIVYFADLKIKLIDTAGIRETNDKIESQGIQKSKEIIDKSDFIISIFDGSAKLDENDKKIISLLKNKKHIKILNKNDKLKIKKELFDLDISLKKENNLEKIEKVFKEKLIGKEIINDFFIANEFQLNKLKEALQLIESFQDKINNNNPDFFILNLELNKILQIILEITGENDPEYLINEMFKNFCLGK